MILELYDCENYTSWEDAEYNGAIYVCELKGEEISTDDIERIIHVTEVCIRNDGNIRWRIRDE